MISVEEALGIVLANLPARKTELVFFRDALGRVSAEDLHATSNIPPFNRSSMDGYAVRSADTKSTPVQLELIGEIRAGGGTPGTVCRGQAMAIMTGGAVPAGADAVQNLEQTERSGDGRFVTLLRPATTGENIVPAGFEAAMGETVIEAGRVIGPAEVAIMATFGYEKVRIWQRPKVAVMATGDELVEVHQVPSKGQIRNSNAYSLCSQLRLLGLDPVYLGIVRDNKDDLRERILDGLQQDVLILSGGVSTGKYDFVKDVFEELGFSVLFSKVAMKPGKPTVFARKDDKLIFGLPGNPVATFVAFENFVRPALGRLCGMAKPELPRVQGRLLREMTQTPGRTAYLPAWVSWEGSGWQIDPLQWKGSADIIGFAKANATVTFPRDRGLVAKGETVEAMLLPDFFARRR